MIGVWHRYKSRCIRLMQSMGTKVGAKVGKYLWKRSVREFQQCLNSLMFTYSSGNGGKTSSSEVHTSLQL